MTKVAVVIDTWFPFIGGGQINAYEIAKRIAGKKFKIDIITRDLGPAELNLPANMSVVKIGSQKKPYDTISKIKFIISAVLYIRQNKYDLVHSHAFLPGIGAWLINLVSKTPTILTVHGTSLNTNLNGIIKTFIEKVILTKIKYNAQISVSQDFLNLKNVNKNIYYISNGVETDQFNNINTKKFKNPTIIYVGRLHPQKNLVKLIEAFAVVKKNHSKAKLIIVGEGSQKEILKRLVHDLDLIKSVDFKGEVTGQEKIKLYKSCHLFILTSLYEGQPLTMLEAWASKLPVIVPKTGDCELLVKEGINGFLLEDVTNSLKIASLIENAITTKNLSKIGQNGYNFVLETFSWDKSAQKTITVYESLTQAQN